MPTEVLNQLRALREGIAETLRKDPRYLTLSALDRSIEEISGVLSASGLAPATPQATTALHFDPPHAAPSATPAALVSPAAVPSVPAVATPAPAPPHAAPPAPKKPKSLLKPIVEAAAVVAAAGLAAEVLHGEAKGKAAAAKPATSDEATDDDDADSDKEGEPEAAESDDADDDKAQAKSDELEESGADASATDGDKDEADKDEADEAEAAGSDKDPGDAEEAAEPDTAETDTANDETDGAAEDIAEAGSGPKGKASGYVPMAAKPGAVQYQPSISVKFGKLPNKVDLRSLMTPIEDQGQTSSCVANAVAGAYEYWIKKASKQDQAISRLFVYYNARWRDGSQDKDEGSVIQLAMEGLSKFGACNETVWPFDSKLILKKPGAEAYKDAAAYRVHDMQQVPMKLDAWKQALAEGKPVVFGIALFDSFDDCSTKGGVVPMPSPDDVARKSHSSHSMCAVGYSDSEKVFIVRNSWGSDWGDKGYCYMPYDYLLNPKFNDGDNWVFVPKIPSQPPREVWSDNTDPVTNGGLGVDFPIQTYTIADYATVAVDLFENVRKPFNSTVLADYSEYVSWAGKGLWSELDQFDVRSFLATTAALTGVSAVATEAFASETATSESESLVESSESEESSEDSSEESEESEDDTSEDDTSENDDDDADSDDDAAEDDDAEADDDASDDDDKDDEDDEADADDASDDDTSDDDTADDDADESDGEDSDENAEDSDAEDSDEEESDDAESGDDDTDEDDDSSDDEGDDDE